MEEILKEIIAHEDSVIIKLNEKEQLTYKVIYNHKMTFCINYNTLVVDEYECQVPSSIFSAAEYQYKKQEKNKIFNCISNYINLWKEKQ